ncbi:hypothetical protein AURDEDRAFT_172049 [Auricularia subglabra TFB-10046 SS5]|nr:hypothetical protein AURDEDRAFT_172049 [Auricularia subglabra TFB-10046 SS5]
MSFQPTALIPEVEAIKSKANEAFIAKKFADAVRLYTEAIRLQPGAEVLYSNRSAAELSKGDAAGALIDATKAGRGDDVIIAIAYGRGIKLSDLSNVSAARKAVIRHLQANPGWDAPVRRALYLASGSGARQLEYDPAKGQKMSAESILSCAAFDSEFLCNEDGAEKMRGNDSGVGIGYTYRIWQVIMDDNANADRPHNPEASALLQRPNLHGPVLVMKTVHLKSTHEHLQIQQEGAIQDVVAWEIVTLDEIKSEEWQEKRAEFLELIKRSPNRGIVRLMENSHHSMITILPRRS